MKWLHDNFVGAALLGALAALLLVSFSLVVVWAWPVSAGVPAQSTDEADAATAMVVVSAIGPISDYQVINERPVFNISRQPEAVEIEDTIEVAEEAPTVVDAPEVKLTGIFISPNVRIASLMPLQGEQISVRAKEGESLVGDYVGWAVSTVRERHVVLTSRNGETLKLELKVHDVKIEEPPKIETPLAVDPALAAEIADDVLVGEDGQPLSRAEQIRARIAERREELRMQQAGQTNGQQENGGETKKAAPPPDYQSAIRAMINNRSKDKNSKDKNGNDEKDS